MGYNYRNYQENKRVSYTLDGVDIEIDSWPLIPTYVEIEGKSEEAVRSMVKKLGYTMKQVTSLDVTTIFEEKYGIDILNIRKLKF